MQGNTISDTKKFYVCGDVNFRNWKFKVKYALLFFVISNRFDYKDAM
jgi:hypothetical protein